jgi:acyl carrier protein
MSKKLYDLISDVLGIPNSEINDNSGPENTDRWDSFKGLLLVYELEQYFNVKFTLDEIYDLKTVLDIKKHLKTYGVNLED